MRLKRLESNIYLFLSLCLIFCIQCNFVEALVGPNIRQAAIAEFPYVVSVMHLDHRYFDPEHDHICSGVLITKSDVLTAAHCFENRLRNETKIVAGSINLLNARMYNILWWISFNDWGDFRAMFVQFRVNDIGIVKLTHPMPYIEPALLTPLRNFELYGENTVLAGWGKSNTGTISTTLLTANVQILTNEECMDRVERLHGARISVNERLLCSAANPFALMHFGDDGGPLLHMNMVVGINKGTVPLPDIPVHPKKINIHTGIEYYRHFIIDVIHPNFEWE